MLFTTHYLALEALALPALAIMIALPSGCSGEQSQRVGSHEAAAVRSGLSIATAEQDADDAAPERGYPQWDAGVSVDDDAGEVGPLSDASTEPRDGAWASAWSRALVPTTVLPYAQPNQFEDQTLRLIVWPTLSGSSVRVKLSNAYATDPRVIGAARVARHQSGGAIIADTDRVLTFDGLPSVTIAAGAEVWSDPVELEIAAHEDLAISIYLPEAFAPAAFHPIGLRTSYISSAGDYTASIAMPAPAEGAQTTSMIFFVAEVQVLPNTGTPAHVVALGDSITDGNCSDVDANGSWPDRLSKRLTLLPDGTPVGVINAGISSNRWVASDAAGLRGSERLSQLLEVPGVRWVVLFEGINDISYEHIQAADLIAAYEEAIAQAHAAQIKIIGVPLLPISHSVKDTPDNQSTRTEVNAWIRSSGAYDAVLDFEPVLGDPEDPGSMRSELTCDHVHPNQAGYDAMATAIDLSLFR